MRFAAAVGMHNDDWILEHCRKFPDHSIRALLFHPDLFLDLVAILAPDLASRIESTRLVKRDPSFIDEAYRERVSDVVYSTTFRDDAEDVWIYCLMEHQSTPDSWTPFRILHAMDGIWEDERREKERRNEPASLSPIIPMVLYTGDSDWESPTDMTRLVEEAARLDRFIPRWDTLYLDLKRTDPRPLEESEHPLAWALRVLREERKPVDSFRDVLAWAAARVNALPEDRAPAWRELAGFLLALVYHRRPETERDGLGRTIRDRLEPRRTQEIETMETGLGQTLEERVRKEEQAKAEIDTRRKTLLRQMERKFGPLPGDALRAIAGATDSSVLDGWLDRILDAARVEDVGVR